ncbi:assimilatory sulfite reductase (NADPH) flavoprotein subunit [Psychrosphaera ytuae]|uniref:Sulfite reductase [NADPH] flavoprotein alpha-component n=1 Tax=Psychrosphaera ytuae TaxID=2820710 RepID=A0A975HJC7_9GAMM|nr:assimilatory sulfite reductase (NADPH) flavoprotein subunit [Psychrosphaera ytuae]QTH63074.1 assimilatory sulfite reductase (NADPH) flavoprotein subunit [Psychrosphaera ytuae]
MSPTQLVQQLNATASPLSAEQITQLNQLVAQLNPIQQAWVSGYLAAASQAQPFSSDSASSQPAVAAKLLILVGSQTGNARGVATQLEQQASQQGLAVELVNMADYKGKDLKKEQFVTIIVSTHGEGDAPDDAVTLHKFLHGKKAPKLDGLKYSVFALGDSSYEFFCKTGHDFDQQLAQLGATRLAPVVEADVDFDQAANDYIHSTIEQFGKALKEINGSSNLPANDLGNVVPIQSASSAFDRNHPFAAPVLANQKITARGSQKHIRHIELSLEDSGISYRPGDALGVWFDNDPALVAEIIVTLNLQAEEQVEWQGSNYSLSTLLSTHLELTLLHPNFVKHYAALLESQGVVYDALSTVLEDKTALRQYCAQRQLLDVLLEFPQGSAEVTASQLVAGLQKLTPRLYSIASSQAEVEDEVHLTVAVVEYESDVASHQHSQTRTGGASGFLAYRAEDAETVNVYVQSNNNFRLPADTSTPVIMIGPGTGIAPFRAFLQEREAQDANGENWLFFGNPHFTTDFLYQAELIKYRDSGLLTRFDVAFSRDQADKIYVQDRIKEQGKAIFEWLEKGAHLYICGDAERMAKDVQQALLDVIQDQAGIDADAAQDYLENLRESQRFQKDVY